MSAKRFRVLAAFMLRDNLRVKYDYNPQFLDMVVGINKETAAALNAYAGLPRGFEEVVARHFGTADEYSRMPSSMAVVEYRVRVESGPSAEAFLEMADTVAGMPLDYAQPVLDAM